MLENCEIWHTLSINDAIEDLVMFARNNLGYLI
ncbi:MAG: hypothetical protein E7206_04805 [Clostridium beijerinckii]|nr:hypothetical protein [Clostridium beijerinckii]